MSALSAALAQVLAPLMLPRLNKITEHKKCRRYTATFLLHTAISISSAVQKLSRIFYFIILNKLYIKVR